MRWIVIRFWKNEKNFPFVEPLTRPEDFIPLRNAYNGTIAKLRDYLDIAIIYRVKRYDGYLCPTELEAIFQIPQ